LAFCWGLILFSSGEEQTWYIMSLIWKLLLVGYLIVIHIMAGLYLRDAFSRHDQRVSEKDSIVSVTNPVTVDTARHAPERKDSSLQYAAITGDADKLLIPVVGVRRGELQDTYDDARSGGRVHDAIDIIAPEGTPVVAAGDGVVAKFFDSKQGGITIYQWSKDSSRIYYYAHLQRRAEGLREGAFVKRGTIIGYVGDTGNAGTGNFHLHFSIMMPSTPGRYWDGAAINPYPILKDGIEVAKG
jgi:murein DD-endopeptidase MepM/ murein hydrolase activator NlpD